MFTNMNKENKIKCVLGVLCPLCYVDRHKVMVNCCEKAYSHWGDLFCLVRSSVIGLSQMECLLLRNACGGSYKLFI